MGSTVANDVRASYDKTTGPTNGRAPRGFWFIYVLGTEDGSEVKTGKTQQAASVRKAQHETPGGRYEPLRTLAVVLGQGADEQYLKRFFSRLRSRPRSKEWFLADDTLRSYLRWLRSQPFVARTDAPADLLHLWPVDAADWLPDDGRTKEPAQLRLGIDDPWADLEVDHVAEGDFYTHQRLIEAARAAMGSIDLDPASCSEANTIVRAQTFYAFRENGLLKDWAGNVWLNPPFGNWGDWAGKAIAEWRSGRINQMCVLASSRVSTAQHFFPIVREAAALVIPCGRYPFWGPKAVAPDEGHFIYYFGPNVEQFISAFTPIGRCYS
jgi:DNA N-6-adenine-methyltransferase (Dam)